MASKEYDLIIIGSGPGGYVCAIRAAQLGLKTAIVEYEDTLGGTCANVGCIPSKALLQSSEEYAKIEHDFASHGIKVDKYSLDLKTMLGRKDEVVKGNTEGVAYLMKKNKVDVLKGRGSFVDANTIKVTDGDGKEESYKTKNTVIATGSKPVEIPPAKFDRKSIVSSTGALKFETVPKHLIVIGGGVIGLELGSVWLRLGSKVTVVEAMDRILPTMDEDISKEALRIFKKQGMEILLNTKLTETKVGKTQVTAKCDKGGEIVELKGDKVLVAVGRYAYTEGLNVEGIKLALERGKVPVDDHWQTSVKGVYAIGDVIAGPMLAHKAEEEGIAVAENIAGKSGHVNFGTIPGVVYTWPEIASVGLTTQECKEQGIEFNVGKFPFSANGRARAMGGSTDGFVKILACKKTDKVLGGHMIGPTASELIAEVVLAMEFGASAEDIARTCHAHPTLSEVTKEAALDIEKRSINK